MFIILFIGFSYVLIRCAMCYVEPHAGNTINLVLSLIIFGFFVVGFLDAPKYV